MATLVSPQCLIDGICKFAIEIGNRFSLLKMNIEEEDRIKKKLHTLNYLLEDLKSLQKISEPPKSLIHALKDLHDQMEKCNECCQPAHARGKITRGEIAQFGMEMLTVKTRYQAARSLETGLDGAIGILQLILQVDQAKANQAGFTGLQKSLCRMNMTVGGAGFCDLKMAQRSPKPSGSVTNLKATPDRQSECLMLTWDYDGDNGCVETYDVSVTGDDGFEIIREAESCSVILYYPLLEPGKRYAFKVRAKGKVYPGKWSSEVISYFKSAVPSKPTKPTARAKGTKEIKVSAQCPSERDCNGADVTHYIIEYLPEDGNSTEWSSKVLPVTMDEIQLVLTKLEEHCRYSVRVRFRNEAGDSPPSDTVTCTTFEPVPGIPTNFRFSSYRTAHMIKLRWNKPYINSRFAFWYEIEYRTRFGKWGPSGTTDRLSYRVKGLSQDKRYYFRIQAVNTNGQKSGYTSEINEETRFNKASKAALAPLVFVGSTLASPFLTSVGAGLASGMVAAGVVSGMAATRVEHINDLGDISARKKTAGVAAGVAGGVGGAVLGTVGAPLVAGGMTYMFTTWGDVYSDQSDEEGEKEGKENGNK